METVKTDDIGTLQILQPTTASHFICEGKGIEEGIVNREAQFTLTSRNGRGKQCYDKRDRVTVEIRDERGLECATKVGINDCDTPKYQGRCQVSVQVNGEHIHQSPFLVLVKPFQLKPVLTFGEEGSSLDMLNNPFGLAVNARDEIAVSDNFNHTIKIFNSDGNYLGSFGRWGSEAGELEYPRGIVFHNNGNIFVADNSSRIQIFNGRGEFVRSFGGRGHLDNQLNDPLGLSVDSDGNVIVADRVKQLNQNLFSRWKVPYENRWAGLF